MVKNILVKIITFLINYLYYLINIFIVSIDVKNLSTIQECHLILAKLMVLETFDEKQSYLLIKLVN